MKLCHMKGHKENIITYIPHLGGTASSKFGRHKTSKIRRDLGQPLSLTANISERIKILTSGQRRY